MTWRDLGGKWEDEVYNWEFSSLGDSDRDRGDYGFVGFVVMLAILTLTVVFLAVV